jgi:hypothetical protein
MGEFYADVVISIIIKMLWSFIGIKKAFAASLYKKPVANAF